MIEIFDQDQVGKSEFIGRTMAKPHVKLREDKYVKPAFPPPLEWFTITRGVDHAGELLAAFELLEIYGGSDSSLPALPKPKDIPIFKVIKLCVVFFPCIAQHSLGSTTTLGGSIMTSVQSHTCIVWRYFKMLSFYLSLGCSSGLFLDKFPLIVSPFQV